MRVMFKKQWYILYDHLTVCLVIYVVTESSEKGKRKIKKSIEHSDKGNFKNIIKKKENYSEPPASCRAEMGWIFKSANWIYRI